MSYSHAGPSDPVTVSPDEAFWDLVCADDEWLREEFEAIVAAEFPEETEGRGATPPATAAAPSRVGPPGGVDDEAHSAHRVGPLILGRASARPP